MTIQINTEFLIHLLAIVAGIIILMKPKLLSYIVAIYLILIGSIGLLQFLGIKLP